MRRVSPASFAVTGYRSISTSATAPALGDALCRARDPRVDVVSRRPSKVRIVPIISTSSGMMLAHPPLIAPTVTIEGVGVASSWREGMVCRPSTICEATTIGSTPPQGMAPCVCRPCTRIRKLSEDAIIPPDRQPMTPTGAGVT